MTYITILIASLLFIIIPIASSAIARQLHFALGLQGEVFNIDSIFGKTGLTLLMDSDHKKYSKYIDMLKTGVTCIYCFTNHIAILMTMMAYVPLFGAWGLLAIFIVPAVALMVQNYLQIKVYSQFYSEEEDVNNETNDGSN